MSRTGTYLSIVSAAIFVSCGCLSQIAFGQVDSVPAQSSKPGWTGGTTTDVMNRLKQGDFLYSDIERIPAAETAEAVVYLKKNFDLTKDRRLKYQVASTLVRLGDKDLTWWDFLVQGANDAITEDIPSSAMFDSTGKAVPDPSPEFLMWVKAHQSTPEEAFEAAQLNYSKILALGNSRDKRAIPLLRQALWASDFLIQSVAAHGLAEVQDKDSVPLIVEACRRVHPQEAAAIARSLRDFKDPKAQVAANEFQVSKSEK